MTYNNIRVYITEKCNAKCPNCFNRRDRVNSQMDISRFEKLCVYLSNNGASQIKIMGGEPTIHPQFQNIMNLAQQYFITVSLFTNAISDNLLEYIPRESDIITYNFKFRGLLDKKRLLLNHPGQRNLEIQITPNTQKERLVENIKKVVSLAPERIIPCFTLDCTADIFKDKDKLISIYEYVWSSCLELGFKVGQDHLIPLCFIANSNIPMPKNGANCTINCAGLIDADFNLKFCNQYPDVLVNLFTDDNIIISKETFNNYIIKKYNNILDMVATKGCSNCSLFGTYCNGGCFAGKEVIKELKL